MSTQSRQALRLLKFVAEMKKNNYPNANSFAKLLRQIDLEENFSCACSVRTVKRDIETLEKDYNAPLAYDHTQRGYYLCQPDWELKMPLLDKNVLDTALLGSQLTVSMMPEPLKSSISASMDKTLANNNSTFFDEAMIESLICASGIKAAADPAVFSKIFDAWRTHQTVKITYQSPNSGSCAEHTVDPHIIAFHQGIWYIKGYKYMTKDIRIYAIHRITAVTMGIDSFETDKQLVENTKRNGLFEYPKIDGIQLRCAPEIAFYLYEHQTIKKFKIEEQTDGSLIVTLRPAVEHDVIRWVLGAAGNIEVLYPLELRKKIADLSKKMWEINSTPLPE